MGSSKPDGRLYWADIVKALLIFFVVIGHAASPYNGYIYLFHVPGFFFISGYLTKIETGSVWEFFIKKTRTLLLPYFCINILFFLIHYLFSFTPFGSLFFKSQMTWNGLLDGLVRFIRYTATTEIGGASWFLLALFHASVLTKIVVSITRHFRSKGYLQAFLCLLIYIVSCYLHAKRIFLPYIFDLGLHASFYYFIGYYFRKHNIFQVGINHIYAVAVSVFILFFFTNIRWAPMNWPTRDFTVPINFFSSLAGIYLCYIAAKWIEKGKLPCQIAAYIGQRTLSILLFHFMGFKVFFLLMVFLGRMPASQISEIVLPYPNDTWLLAGVFGIGFSLFLERQIRRYDKLSLWLLGSGKALAG